MMFLFRHIDSSSLKSFGRLDEEVVALYKRLRYPFQISKSNLSAVGSPHTWPAILAAITWLVKLISYAALAEQEEEEEANANANVSNGGGNDMRADTEFFNYVSKSYRLFMAGDDDACQAVDEEQVGEVEDRANMVRQDIAHLEGSNAALREEIGRIKNEPSPLLKARAAVEETQGDKEKFVTLLDNLKAHQASLQRKVAERRSDIVAQHQELVHVEAQNDALRAKINSQTVHPADVIRMNQEMSQQEAALRSLTAQREAADTKALQSLAALEARMDTLEASLQGYNAAADRLRLVPASAKRAEGTTYECKLNRALVSQHQTNSNSSSFTAPPDSSSFLSVDLKSVVRPALERLRDNYAIRARDLEEESLTLRDQRNGASEALGEREEECRSAEGQVAQLESQHKAMKETLDAAMAAGAARAEILAGEVDKLRNAKSQNVEDSEERLRALQGEQEDLFRHIEMDSMMLHRDLAAALEGVLNHKVQLQGKLKGLHERMARLCQEVAALPLPTV